jgi:hypothetical protein
MDHFDFGATPKRKISKNKKKIRVKMMPQIPNGIGIEKISSHTHQGKADNKSSDFVGSTSLSMSSKRRD